MKKVIKNFILVVRCKFLALKYSIKIIVIMYKSGRTNDTEYEIYSKFMSIYAEYLTKLVDIGVYKYEIAEQLYNKMCDEIISSMNV